MLYAQNRWSLLLDFPGHGRGRQGQHDQARHVGRQSAGLPGRLVQAPVVGGPRSRLHVAISPGLPRARPDRHLQPVLLRRGSRSCACTRRSSKGSASRRRTRKTHLGGALDDITHFEGYLTRNGTIILKFFLNSRSEEQRKRFLERLEGPDKNWKFSESDVTSANSGTTTCTRSKRPSEPLRTEYAVVRGASRQQVVYPACYRGGNR